jgi:hypothetical protein
MIFENLIILDKDFTYLLKKVAIDSKAAWAALSIISNSAAQAGVYGYIDLQEISNRVDLIRSTVTTKILSNQA